MPLAGLCNVTIGLGVLVSDIVVGDVLSWEPDLEWSGNDDQRDRPLTWAVTIHATVPVLPPLRGGELIVAPSRTLAQLQSVEMIAWADIARTLAGQAIAGVVVERGAGQTPVPGIPVLTAPATFLQDAESRLNRTITEHRAELYHLGSDLSRALSAASIGGADLDALLAVAGDLAGRHLALVDATGAVLASSRGAPANVPFDPDNPRGGWTFQASALPGAGTVYLGAGPRKSGPPEATRLVLSQTLAAIEAFLGPEGIRRSPADSAPGREALLADLLLGSVPQAQIASRCKVLSIDPDEAVSVALFIGTEPGFDGRLRTGLRREIRERICMLSPLEMAVLVPESGWDNWWSELQALARQQPDVVLVRSEQQPDAHRAPVAARQARAVGKLQIPSGARSVFDILLPVWDPSAFEPGRERLRSFADDMLLSLETHDRERGSDLVQTLIGYLAAGGSATGAAVRLSIHRNTLAYRLRRIAELTGSDLEDEEVRLAFGLALKIRQIQRALE